MLGALLLAIGTRFGLWFAGTPMPSAIDWTLAPFGIAVVIASVVTVRRGGPLFRAPLVAAFILVSLVGVWAGPPENDHTVAAVGAGLGCLLVVAVWPGGMDWVAGAVGCAVVVWAALGAGARRFDPTIAGFLCLGLLPFGVLLTTRTLRALLETRRGEAVLLMAHLGIVLVAARVYAARHPDGFGFLCVLAAGGIALALLPRAMRWACS